MYDVFADDVKLNARPLPLGEIYILVFGLGYDLDEVVTQPVEVKRGVNLISTLIGQCIQEVGDEARNTESCGI